VIGTRIDLDHVAVATDDLDAAFATLVGDLGGTVFHGGDGSGFRWVQTRVGTVHDGMTVESLVVWQPEVNDFLARFVDRFGSASHHITFKVADLETMLDRCRAAGLHPVGVDLRDPHWQEAFLQPREAHGTVIQLAQTDEPHDVATLLHEVERTGPLGQPCWWPEPPAPGTDPAALRAVVLGTPDRMATTTFFTELLAGTVEYDGEAGTGLAWPGGRIRLEDAETAGVVRFDAVGVVERAVTIGRVPVVVTSA
jgi:methylmalonyl-CoA/ethylmalonyl-CoA epimerase